MIAGLTQWPVWCHLYHTGYWRKRLKKTQNGRTVLPVTNLMTDSEPGSLYCYSSFLVTIMSISLSLGDIRVWQTDGWTDTVKYYYSWPHNVAGQLTYVPNNSDDLGLTLTCSCILLLFQWSCAYNDAHDKTGSADWVSRLVTVPTDPFTRPSAPFMCEWAKCQPRNTQNGRTVLLIVNHDGRFWIGKSRFLYELPSNHTSISLSFGDVRLWQTDNANHYYSWPPRCGGPAKNTVNLRHIMSPMTHSSHHFMETDVPISEFSQSLGLSDNETDDDKT